MTLMKLPDELLVEIARHLHQDLIDPPIVLGAFDDDHDAIADSKALANLALANRRLTPIATDFLYRTIRIHRLCTLYSLLLTLLKAPHLAGLVEGISLTASLDLGDVKRESDDALERLDNLLQRFEDDDVQAIISCVSEPVAQPSHAVCEGLADFDCVASAEAACAILLLITPNVTSLHLKLPTYNVGDYDFLFDVLGRGAEALAKLERLILVSDPGACDSRLDDSLPDKLMVGRKVKHLELFGPQFWNLEHMTKDAWKHVETLRMEFSFLTAMWWYHLCKDVCPPLKTVDVSLSPYFGETIEDLSTPGLNEALSFCTETLETLHLDLGDNIIDGEPYIGPQRRLSCLASMQVLSDLAIPPWVLFSSLGDMRCTNICERLPSSLRRLKVLEESYMTGQTNPWVPSHLQSDDESSGESWDGKVYQQVLRKCLHELAFESADRLPRLERVTVIDSGRNWDNTRLSPELKSIASFPPAGVWHTMMMMFSPKR
jgi:hypothetical protein